MRKVCLAFVGVLALAACSGRADRQGYVTRLVKTPLGPPATVRLGDLTGLTPAQVQTRLTGQAWPTPFGLEMTAPAGTLAFANLGEWLRDDASHRLVEGWRDDHGAGAFAACRATTDPDGAGASLTTLQFHDGRFVAAWADPGPGAPPKLTLEDGPGFLDRWGRRRMDPDTRLTVTCQRATEQRVATRGRPLPDRGPTWILGALMSPLWLQVGHVNARRAQARADGGEAFAALPPGAALPDAQAFARRHSSVTVRPGGDPRYVLLEIDLGAPPSGNVTYFHRIALAGVRDGRVVWRERVGLPAVRGLAPERELPLHRKDPVLGA